MLNSYKDVFRNEEQSLLCEYIAVFINNAHKVRKQEDERILFYRGQSNKNFDLTPGIFRNGLLPKEHIIIQELLLEAPGEFNIFSNVFEYLIKMQHYNSPTRLLDITLNPLVALYFACNENPDEDGEIIVFYDYMMRPNDFFVRGLISLSEYHGSNRQQMARFLKEKGFKNPELDKLAGISHIFMKAPLNNERIRRQHGAFIITGITVGEEGNLFQKERFDLKPLLVRRFDDFGDSDTKPIERSIIIPKESKDKILSELNVLGINQAFLFPELEYQAAYIKGKYEEGYTYDVHRS